MPSYKAELEKAKAVEAKNKAEVAKLIAEAESYLKAHYGRTIIRPWWPAARRRRSGPRRNTRRPWRSSTRSTRRPWPSSPTSSEIKDEKYVHKNRLFDAKMSAGSRTCRQSRTGGTPPLTTSTTSSTCCACPSSPSARAWPRSAENYKYTFNRRDFLLRNGLYIAIIIIFIGLCIATPIIKGVPLLTVNNILNILSAGLAAECSWLWASRA